MKILILLLFLFSSLLALPSVCIAAQPSARAFQGKIISRTVRETTESGLAVSIPVIISVLALVSALISVAFSLMLKDKEYRNDYYKIVIAKRLKAVEAAEVLIDLFNRHQEFNNTEDENEIKIFRFHQLLHLDAERSSYVSFKSDPSLVATWYSPATEICLEEFETVVRKVFQETDKVSEKDRPPMLIKEFDNICFVFAKLEHSLNEDMCYLYDVKSFFDSKTKHTAALFKAKQALANSAA